MREYPKPGEPGCVDSPIRGGKKDDAGDLFDPRTGLMQIVRAGRERIGRPDENSAKTMPDQNHLVERSAGRPFLVDRDHLNLVTISMASCSGT
jgi:hypothetical protein